MVNQSTSEKDKNKKEGEKEPFHMPLRIRLLADNGEELLPETVVELTQAKQTFEFPNIKTKPVLSFLRGYSAPVKVEIEQSAEELDCLIRHDNDPFVRWEAMQQRLLNILLFDYKLGKVTTQLPESVANLFEQMLIDAGQEDPAMLASLLSLPNESYLSSFCEPIDPQLLRKVRESFADLIAAHCEALFKATYLKNHNLEYELNGLEDGKRELKSVCLSYLMRLNKTTYFDLARAQFDAVTNMTDSITALSCLVNSDYPDKADVLDTFYAKWQDNALVLDKWLTVQASAKNADTFDQVKALFSHSAFSMKNPNKVRSLLGAFAQNSGAFHRADATAYQFYADRVLELDAINPQVAARMVGVFNAWKSYTPEYADLMVKELTRIESHKDLSKDVREIVSKALKH